MLFLRSPLTIQNGSRMRYAEFRTNLAIELCAVDSYDTKRLLDQRHTLTAAVVHVRGCGLSYPCIVMRDHASGRQSNKMKRAPQSMSASVVFLLFFSLFFSLSSHVSTINLVPWTAYLLPQPL